MCLSKFDAGVGCGDEWPCPCSIAGEGVFHGLTGLEVYLLLLESPPVGDPGSGSSAVEFFTPLFRTSPGEGADELGEWDLMTFAIGLALGADGDDVTGDVSKPLPGN